MNAITTGSILVSAFASDGSKFQFWRVLSISGNMAFLCPMQKQGITTLEPKEGSEHGEVIRRKIKGNFVRTYGTEYAHVWNGKPLAR